MKQVIPGGWHCDALPSGEYVALVPNQYMATHLGHIDFADKQRQPLFVRCTNVGGFSFAGQSWGSPELLLWAAQWSFGPAVGGVSPVIFRNDGSLQTKPFVYPNGSICTQGWRFVDKAGRLWHGDETYGPTPQAPKLYEWTDLSDGDTLVVGQGEMGGVVVWDGTAHRQLATGACRFIRAHREGEKVSIAFYRELGSVSESEIHWVTVAELRALPVVIVPPPPPPPRPDNFGQRSGRMADGTVIDLRKFVFGAASTFPRTGAHPMHQADLGGGKYALVKFGQTRCYELWSLGENYIHHLEDASDGRLPKDVKPGEKPPTTYHFTDTRWMPFIWKVGDSFKVPAHEAVFFNRDTGVEFDRWPYARRMQIVEAWEQFDCGPDLGIRRTICVLYDPTDGWHGPDRFVELFWFAEGAGWIGWHPHRSDLVFAGGGQKFDTTTQSEALKGFYLFGSSPVTPALTGLDHAPTEVSVPPPPPPPPVPASWQMKPGDYLYPDKPLVSQDKRFSLLYQSDGNLVLYGPKGSMWASGTNGQSVGFCALQGDGNFVLYDKGVRPRWSSGTAGKPASFLIVQNDGNVVLYGSSGPLWSTATVYQPPPSPPPPPPTPIPPGGVVPNMHAWPKFGGSYATGPWRRDYDPSLFASLNRDAGGDYTRFWLLDAWGVAPNGPGQHDGIQPWQRDSAGVFDLSAPNPEWDDRLNRCVRIQNNAGATVQISVLNLYSWSTRTEGRLWVPDPNLGPFRRNRNGVRWDDDTTFDRLPDWVVDQLIARACTALNGLAVQFEVAGNEFPEKSTHVKMAAMLKSHFTSTWRPDISCNRNDDTPGQYFNMKIGRQIEYEGAIAQFDLIAYHGKDRLSYLDDVDTDEPSSRPNTFRKLFEQSWDEGRVDPSRIIMSSDGCRKSGGLIEDCYDWPVLAEVVKDHLRRGFTYEHQSRIKMRPFLENRLDLNDFEGAWLRSLR